MEKKGGNHEETTKTNKDSHQNQQKQKHQTINDEKSEENENSPFSIPLLASPPKRRRSSSLKYHGSNSTNSASLTSDESNKNQILMESFPMLPPPTQTQTQTQTQTKTKNDTDLTIFANKQEIRQNHPQIPILMTAQDRKRQMLMMASSSRTNSSNLGASRKRRRNELKRQTPSTNSFLFSQTTNTNTNTNTNSIYTSTITERNSHTMSQSIPSSIHKNINSNMKSNISYDRSMDPTPIRRGGRDAKRNKSNYNDTKSSSLFGSVSSTNKKESLYADDDGVEGSLERNNKEHTSSSYQTQMEYPKECCICMNELTYCVPADTPRSNRIGPESDIIRTSCGHVFHRDCLGGWLQGQWDDIPDNATNEQTLENDDTARETTIPYHVRRRRTTKIKASRRVCPLCRNDLVPESPPPPSPTPSVSSGSSDPSPP